MRRKYGIYLIAGGVAVVVLSLRGGVYAASPTYLLTGLLAVFTGVVVYGLGFIRPHRPGPDAPPPLPFIKRVAGLFYDPPRVFENLREHPRWFGTFVLLVACSFAYQTAYFARVTPRAVVSARVDRAVEGGWLSADVAPLVRERAMKDYRSPLASVSTWLRPFSTTFLRLLVLAALYLVGVRALGGGLDFWQALAVAVNAQFPVVFIEQAASFVLLFTLPTERIDLLRGQQGILRLDLAAVLGRIQSPALYVLASFVGVFALYYLWLAATGLRRTGVRVSAGKAWAVVSFVWGLGLAVYVAAALVSPQFAM